MSVRWGPDVLSGCRDDRSGLGAVLMALKGAVGAVLFGLAAAPAAAFRRAGVHTEVRGPVT
jgi:hypothetical protein